MEEWRLLRSSISREAAINLAIEEAIVTNRNKSQTTVRFWRTKNAVILGYSQSVKREVDFDLCVKENVEIARRLSGGGTVYQDGGNLNYSIVMDSNHSLVKDLDILQSYRMLCGGVIRLLKSYGLAPSLSPSSDIMIRGKKISGNAQSRKKGSILHHGTLLIRTDLNLLKSLLHVPLHKSTSIRKEVTNLSTELGGPIDMEEVERDIQISFENAFHVRLVLDELNSNEKDEALRLYRERYSQRKWNLCR